MTQQRIQGARELERALKLLPSRVQRKVIRAAARSGGGVIATQARRNIRKNFKQRSRTLVRSIKVEAIRGAVGHVVIGPTGGSRSLKFDAFYARFLELGTRYITPRPFMRPAFDTAWRKALERTGETLARGLAREAKKLVSQYSRRRL